MIAWAIFICSLRHNIYFSQIEIEYVDFIPCMAIN